MTGRAVAAEHPQETTPAGVSTDEVAGTITSDIDALDHWAHTVLTHHLCEIAGWTGGAPFTTDLRAQATQTVRPGPICGAASRRFQHRAAENVPASMADHVQLQTMPFVHPENTADIYGRNIVSRYGNGVAASVVNELDPASMLEIGAGVGATSVAVTPAGGRCLTRELTHRHGRGRQLR